MWNIACGNLLHLFMEQLQVVRTLMDGLSQCIRNQGPTWDCMTWSCRSAQGRGRSTHLWDYIWDILLDHGGEINLGLCWKQMNRTWVLEHNILIKDEAWLISSLSNISNGPKSWFSCPCKFPSHWLWGVHSDVIKRERMWKKYLEVSSGIGVKKIWISSCCLSL